MKWKPFWIGGSVAFLSVIAYSLVERMTTYEGYWGTIGFYLVASPILIYFIRKKKRSSSK